MMNKLPSLLLGHFLVLALVSCVRESSTGDDNTGISYNMYQRGLAKLEYNNPGLLVDLDVGFKSDPMPMDFDGDGDLDLLVSESSSYTESGVFYFENISGNQDLPIFRYGMKVSTERFRQGLDGMCFEVSQVHGTTHVITPDRVNQRLLIYKDVPQNVFWNRKTLPIDPGAHVANTRHNTWKMVDFDNDGTTDLMCGVGSRISGNFLLFFRNSGTDQDPVYDAPEKITDETGEPIGAGLRMEALIADFDNDQDLDYMAVSSYAGFVYFENRGTPQKYKFAAGRELFHGDEKLQMISSYGRAIKASAFDWNRDGHVDIIAGDEDGKVSFIKNTGKVNNGIPEFLPPSFLQQEARFVDFGALTAPRIYDWDNDGNEDIVSGNGLGSVGFIRNLGGDIPKWAAPQLLEAAGKEIKILPEGAHWGYTTIDVGEWNHDGLPDILVNHHHGNVLWFENIGTRRRPELAEAKPIEVTWTGEPQKPKWVPGSAKGNELLAPWRTSPYIVDFNGDGLNDLVMLDYEGYLVVYPRYRDDTDTLRLSQPLRSFIFDSGDPILLNQLTGGSSGRLKITFADWDGDGLEDLIVSSKPAVDWMKNMGRRNGKMVLQYMGRVASRTLMGHTDGPVVSDFNKDGIPDLLVGTETGAFYYWERTSHSITTTMTTEGVQNPAKYEYFKR